MSGHYDDIDDEMIDDTTPDDEHWLYDDVNYAREMNYDPADPPSCTGWLP